MSTRHRHAFEALGDEHRLAIVELLSQRPRSVQELADRLPISRPAVSRHLKVLREAGLVAESDADDGRRHVYRVRADGLDATRRYLEKVWETASRRFVLAAENTRERGRRG